MILTVNPFVALMFRTVSLSPDVVRREEKDITGGELDTYCRWLVFRSCCEGGFITNLIKKLQFDTSIDKLYEHSININFHLKGAIFSIPSSDVVETKATGRGTMPDMKVAYNLLYFNNQKFFEVNKMLIKTTGLLLLYRWSSILLSGLQPKLYRLQLLRSLAYISILVVGVRCKQSQWYRE